MRQNFITDPFRSQQDQHALPISPQNFDPLDKPKEHYPQKKPIFSSAPSKPKTLFEAMSEVERPPVKAFDASNEEDDLKKMLSKEMSVQLEGIKNEILEGFTALLKGTLNPGKIANKDVQDMKKQMIYNKNKFEEIQDQIGHLNQQYNDINSHYVQEIQSLKSMTTLSTQARDPDYSGFEDEIQSQIETQLQSFKQEVLSELQSTLNSKGKARKGGDVVDELNQIKYSFEGELKQNFEMINGRVKRAEENLNEIMRRKRDYMDSIRADSMTSLDRQNRTITQEMNNVSNSARSKYEQSQVRVAVNAEINRRADSYRAEVDDFRKAIMLNQENVEEVNKSMNRRLEGLESNMKRQIFDLQTSNKKGEASIQRPDLIEKRIQKLNGDSEMYYNTIQQLRSQLEEVTKMHKTLQNQASTSSSQKLVNKLEDKIMGLQNQIKEIESEIKKQQQVQNPLKMSSPVPKTTRATPISENNDNLWQTPKTQRAEFRSPFENETSGPKERRINNYQTTNEEKLRFPDFSGSSSKYSGDPKVKTIIDEYHQKKRQVPGFSPEKKRNLERPSQADSLTDLGSFRDPRRSHYNPPTVTSKSHRDLQEVIVSPLRNQKNFKYFGTEEEMSRMKTKTSDEVVQRPQILLKKASMELNNPKKIKHAKILSQINYFIYGAVSNILDEEEDSEIYCNLDDNGYIFDEDGDFVLDSHGNRVKLTPEQIEKFNNNNMIE